MPKRNKTIMGMVLVALFVVASPTLMTINHVFAQGQAGTTLIAVDLYGGVTATAHWTRPFEWTISKSVVPTTLSLNAGETGTVEYTVAVTKTQLPDEYYVDGTVCVTNDGGVPTENLAITANLYYPPAGPSSTKINSITVDVSSNPVLDPNPTYPNPIYGEQGCYAYRVDIPSAYVHLGGTYKVTADITITNHSGHLGIPFGPNPSSTSILPSTPTLINDSVNVDDTNGQSWSFTDSGSLTYAKDFTYNDAGTYVNENTATIRETGQSSSATVTVTVIATDPTGSISGHKFYDVNTNGVRDSTEVLIAGWKIELFSGTDTTGAPLATTYTNSEGLYSFADLQPGTYTVVEVLPQGKWVATTAKAIEVNLIAGQASENNDFGNVCLGAGGGLTVGYWSNKNGYATMNDGNTVVPELTLLSGLNLRAATGTDFNPIGYDQYRSWLLSASATNMAYMLSAQLSAMELNVEAGKVSASTLVYAPGVTGANAAGFISISDLMNAANNALGSDGYTPSGNPDRASQELLKNALDAANNNLNFVQPAPCPFTSPY